MRAHWAVFVALLIGLCVAVDIPVTNVEFTGRINMVNDNKIAQFEWSGVDVHATFIGTSISAIFNDSTGNQYNAYVDGRLATVINTTVAKEYMIASGLKTGVHTVSLKKRTEAFLGVAQFGGFNAGNQDQSSIVRTKKTKSIEFIGDSITCGYGDLGTYPCSFSPDTEDETKAYGYLTADHFGAQLHVESWSGKGLVRNYADKNITSEHPFPFYYPLTLPTITSSAWDFSKWIPDAVVINLGTNDYSTQPAPPEDIFVPAYHKFLEYIWGKYGRDTTVFLACGPMIGNPCCQYVENVVESYNGKGVHFVNLQGILSFPSDFGCDGHPNVSGHRKMAQITIPVVQKFMNW